MSKSIAEREAEGRKRINDLFNAAASFVEAEDQCQKSAAQVEETMTKSAQFLADYEALRTRSGSKPYDVQAAWDRFTMHLQDEIDAKVDHERNVAKCYDRYRDLAERLTEAKPKGA